MFFVTLHLPPELCRPPVTWLGPCPYSEFVVDGDGPDGKRRSLIVPDSWKRGRGMSGAEQSLVVGEINHDVWMPMTRGSKNLVRRPHVGKAHFWALWDLAFGVSGLHRLCNLFGRLSFQPQLCPKFVVRKYGSRGQRVETNGSAGFCVVGNVGANGQVSKRRRSGKPAHDDADITVVALVRDLKSRRCEDLDRRVFGNEVRSRAFRQRDLSVSSHHVLAERGILRFLRIRAGDAKADQQQKQPARNISVLFHVNSPSRLIDLDEHYLLRSSGRRGYVMAVTDQIRAAAS